MNKRLVSLIAVISWISLLLFSIGCQDQGQKARLERLENASKTNDRNKEIARDFFSAIDHANFDKLKELLSDDFTLTAPGAPQPWKQAELFQGIKTFYVSFPDWTHVIEDVIAEGDKVVVTLRGQGTFKTQYEGITPTGEKVTQSAMHVLTFVNGKVKHLWAIEDNLGLMQQLGMELKPTKIKK